MKRMSRLIAVLGALSLVVGCGSAETAADKATNGTTDTATGTDNGTTTGGDTGSTTGSGTTGNGTDTSTGECEARTFNATATQVQGGADNGGVIIFNGQQEVNGSADLLIVESWGQIGGPQAAGTYRLDSTKNYKDCSLCVLMATQCTDQGCAKYFFATEGTVTIEAYSVEAGQTATVTVSGLEMVEVTIAEDYTSTPVAGGQNVCVETATLSGEVQAAGAGGGDVQTVEPFANPSPVCVEDGNGNSIGNNVKAFELQNCLGETVNMADLYCAQGQKAVWFATSAEWCGPCKQYDPIFNDLAMKNDQIDFYVILGQDSSGGTSNMAAECASGFGYGSGSIAADPASHVLLDPNWTVSDAAMNNYGAPGIPYGRVLAGDNMQYTWTEYANDGVTTDVEKALKAASGLDTITGWDQFVQNMQ
jgi:thiol-disulfide isomerase/thioredoxin